jgi:hypothetical protein
MRCTTGQPHRLRKFIRVNSPVRAQFDFAAKRKYRGQHRMPVPAPFEMFGFGPRIWIKKKLARAAQAGSRSELPEIHKFTMRQKQILRHFVRRQNSLAGRQAICRLVHPDHQSIWKHKRQRQGARTRAAAAVQQERILRQPLSNHCERGPACRTRRAQIGYRQMSAHDFVQPRMRAELGAADFPRIGKHAISTDDDHKLDESGVRREPMLNDPVNRRSSHKNTSSECSSANRVVRRSAV